MEITKDKVTELFCIIDEFYKVFDAEILDSCIAYSYAFFLSVVEKRGQNKLLLLKIMPF